MNTWIAGKKFNETLIPNKEAFYSKLNWEDITEKDCAHAQKVWDMFKTKNLGDLYVLSDTLLLPDVFENFRDKRIEIYQLDLAHFLSAPGLACQACLKNAGVNLESLIDIDRLLIVEKRIRGGICQAIHRFTKANNKHANNYDNSIESSYLMYLDANNLYRWSMSQKTSYKWFQMGRRFIKI